MALSPAERLQLAMSVPGYPATVTIDQALASVDAAYAAAYPPPPPPTPAVLAATVVEEVRAVQHDLSLVHTRTYADGHRTSVAADGTETVIAPATTAS